MKTCNKCQLDKKESEYFQFTDTCKECIEKKNLEDKKHVPNNKQ